MKTHLRDTLIFAALLVICSVFAHSQSVVPFMGIGNVQFLDNNGNPLANGVLYSYQAGTTTQQATYTDSTGLTANPHPLPFGAGGRVAIWLSTGAYYKFVLCMNNDGPFCAPADVLFSIDQVPATSGGSSGSGTYTGTFISGTANPATTGILRLASGDQICWRNAAGTANLCISKDSSDVLEWAGNALKMPEGNCTNSFLGFDYLCASSTNHRWMMAGNGGSQVQVAAAGQDINNSDFVTQVHFGSTPAPFSSTAPDAVLSPYLFWTGTAVGGAPAGAFSVVNDGTTGTTLNLLAKLTTANPAAAIALTTSDYSPLGVVIAGAGTTGSATISNAGITPCVFDGSTTAGDYVVASSITGGNCHDAGTFFSPAVFAQVLSTNTGGGTYNIVWLRRAAPTLLSYSDTTISSNVAVNANNLTTVMSKSLTMPATGCPCRALVTWSFHLDSTSSNVIDADVTDGTNHFAGSSFNMTGSTSYTGMTGSGTSPVTYANGQTVNFTAEIENNNGGMFVVAAANFSGFGNSHMTITVVTSN